MAPTHKAVKHMHVCVCAVEVELLWGTRKKIQTKFAPIHIGQ